MNRRRLKLRLARGCLHQLGRLRQIEVDQLSTIVADGVVVPISLSIVTTGAVAKLDFVYQPSLLEEAERVVDSGMTNRRQVLARPLKDLVRRRVVFPRADNLEHRIALPCQFFFGGTIIDLD